MRSTLVLALLSFFVTAFASPVSAATVTDLMPEDLYDWYSDRTWGTPNASTFGAYLFEDYGGTLYLGLSSGNPVMVGDDGAMLASFDGSSLTEEGELDEQGFWTLEKSGDKLFMLGGDPDNGDGWDAGNFYKYDITNGTFTKYRYQYDTYHFVTSTTTDANGNYSFANLIPTAYQVKFILPADYAFTSVQGTYDTYFEINSNPDANGIYYTCSNWRDKGLKHLSSFTDDSIDAGIYSDPGHAAGTANASDPEDTSFFTGTHTIGDLVWNDLDEDGFQDDGEPGVSGVRIELYTKDPYFPCVTHGDGLLAEDNGQTLYASSNPPLYHLDENNESLASHGVVWKSTDSGDSWTVIHESLTSRSTHSFFRIQGNIYSLFRPNFISEDGINWYETDVGVYYSSNDTSWTQIPFDSSFSGTYDIYYYYIAEYDRYNLPVSFRGGTIIPYQDGTGLFKFTGNADYLRIPVTGASFLYALDYDSAYYGVNNHRQNFTSTNGEYLVGIGDDNKLYASTNMRTWTELADFSQVDSAAELVAVNYWSNQEKIIAATAGSTGSVYSIPLSDASDLFATINNNTSLTFNDSDETSLDLETIGNTGSDTTQIRYQNYLLSEVTTTFSGSSLDWSTVDGEVDVAAGKSYIKNLIGSTGAATTHDLYIPIPSSGGKDYAVVICPNPSSLNDVVTNCSNGVTFKENETKPVNGVTVTVTKETTDGQAYWKASGVNGTGGLSIGKDTTATGTPVCNQQAPQGKPIITSITSQNLTSALITFTAPTQNVTNYVLKYGTQKGIYPYGSPNIGNPGTTTYLVTGLVPGQTYYFQIMAVDSCATGEWSDVCFFFPSLFKPITKFVSSVPSIPQPTNLPTPSSGPENPSPNPPNLWHRLLRFLHNLF